VTEPYRPTVRMSREDAFLVLQKVGWATGTVRTNLGHHTPLDVLTVAVGTAESGLFVDAKSPLNADGSQDFGWKQINTVHGYDEVKLLSDPVFCAQAALQILSQQGLRAWYAYQLKNGAPGPYQRHLPPAYGGAELVEGSNGLLVSSLQLFLNTQPTTEVPLKTDGGFGPATKLALQRWKGRFHSDGNARVTPATWRRMESFGLR
jgi:hypothetical protein